MTALPLGQMRSRISAVVIGLATLSTCWAGPSDACRVCHQDLFREWKESWHSKSTRNQNFQIAFGRHMKDGGEAGECMACHAPAPILQNIPPRDGQRTPPVHRGPRWGEGARGPLERPPADLDPQALVEAMTRKPRARVTDLGEGVDCLSCHLAGNDVLVGPYTTSATHPTHREPTFKTVRACVSCHGQLKAPCQKQVQAYEQSPVKTRAVCQSCHMPAREDKLVQWINVQGVPTRRVASHRFPGVHDDDMLASAIGVDVEVVEGMVVVGLTNKGSGHLVPASPWRKLIVLVQVYDGLGREVLRKRDGYFQERKNAIRPTERETVIFGRRSGHHSVKVTLYYRFYPNQPDGDARMIAQRRFSL